MHGDASVDKLKHVQGNSILGFDKTQDILTKSEGILIEIGGFQANFW